MTHVRDFHEQWRQAPAYRNAYEQLEPEFALARALIEARTKAGLTQEQLAERMHTTHVIARREGGQVRPSTRTLERFAKATSTRLKNQL
jgi:ribosome-binding protein aMBF1 (putative translation factor)